MIRKKIVFAILFVLGVSTCYSQSDSILIANFSGAGGQPVLLVSSSLLMCAMEADLGDGTDITSVALESIGPQWHVVGYGSKSGNCRSVAYALTQYGSNVYYVNRLNAGAKNECQGVGCSLCQVYWNETFMAYGCICRVEEIHGAYCNHSTSEGSDLIDSLEECES